ncbi:nitronate monooxygenase [Cryobacterium sp. TMS1-20-1]|uniref:NAD(P)H-dependent flavin oxidoreductase n=1 Tax=Cryobacterium sp. TMS1-20-1 TaxID=1259223 RepID=UPI001068FC10|nr:nitronate monooxygenase [Cryobacterium sp. TMS1-20-1]TFC70963.1 nitronate monooxygenase [Cryobacterium sp. TMS1-20-1]
MTDERFTEMFSLTTPVMQGGMQGIGTATLAAAVSNAGGLGTITALTFSTPELLAAEIDACFALTARPFAVNLTMLPSITPPPYDAYLSVLENSGIAAVELSGTNPAPITARLHTAGIRVIHKATSLKHALKAEASGVDVVAVIGFEAAGHPGELDVPTSVLLQRVVEQVAIPVLAAGGLANGRGIASMLMLGAAGAMLATRFMATEEAPIHDNVKQSIIDHTELDTVLLFRELNNTARVARNAVSVEAAAVLARGGSFDDVQHLVAGARGREVYRTGDLDAGIWWASQAQGLIYDAPSCSVLLQRIAAEIDDAVARIRSPKASSTAASDIPSISRAR